MESKNFLLVLKMDFNIEQKQTLVRDVFECIEKEKDFSSTEWYPEFEKEIEKKNKKYPKQLAKLDTNDLDQLKGMHLEEITFQTPLEKLLFAIIWKQGDFHKIDSLINAAVGGDHGSNRRTGFVFHQFGKHLSDSNQPIIDRHVLRSFKAYTEINDQESFKIALKYDGVTKDDTGLIQEYVDWFKDQRRSSVEIDELLFVLGKRIKLK